jgi:hypothetical protein
MEQPPMEQPPMEQPAAPQGGSPESLEDLVTQVKKNIRQQIMDELAQEVQGLASQSFLDQPKDYAPISTNDNLVKAFIQEYKPKTGWSSPKLASVCKMVVAHTEKRSLNEFAKNRRDAIDFFEFVDKFSQNGLSNEQYNILRRASSKDFSSADAFLNYLKTSGVSDKNVIKKIFERASLLKVLNDNS